MYASTDLYETLKKVEHIRCTQVQICILVRISLKIFCIVFWGVESKKHFCLPAHPCQDVSIETEWMFDRIDELVLTQL